MKTLSLFVGATIVIKLEDFFHEFLENVNFTNLFFNLLERTLSLLRQELRKLLCIAFAKNEKRKRKKKKKEWVAFYSTRKRRMNSCIFRNFQWKKSSNSKFSKLIRLDSLNRWNPGNDLISLKYLDCSEKVQFR